VPNSPVDMVAGMPNDSAKGQETADGSTTAAMVVRYRLDGPPVIIDGGGGYGGGVTVRLRDNGIEPVSFIASGESFEKTKDGSLAFANKRAEAGGNSGKHSTLTSRTARQSHCLPILS
jgi:hypothetical protein